MLPQPTDGLHFPWVSMCVVANETMETELPLQSLPHTDSSAESAFSRQFGWGSVQAGLLMSAQLLAIKMSLRYFCVSL